MREVLIVDVFPTFLDGTPDRARLLGRVPLPPSGGALIAADVVRLALADSLPFGDLGARKVGVYVEVRSESRG